MAHTRFQSALNRTQRRARTNHIPLLRKAFFANAGETAKRYHLSFDDLLLHLWQARCHGMHFSLGKVHHISDLVHAVACSHCIGLAWQDFSHRYESTLIRHCRNWMDEPAAIMFVRRLIRNLSHSGSDCSSLPLPHPQAYLGTQPLRRWLSDRVSGYLVLQRVWGEEKTVNQLRLAGSWGAEVLEESPPSDDMTLDNAVIHPRLRYATDGFISSAR